MKLTQFGSILLLGAASVSASVSGHAAVYELNETPAHNPLVASVHDSIVYLADKFGVSDYYSIGRHSSKSVDLIKKLHTSHSEKPAAVFILKGVDEPASLATDNLSFEINLLKGRHVRKLVGELFESLPDHYAKAHNSLVTKVSNEINMVAPQGGESKAVKHVFKRLQDDLPRLWNDLLAGNGQTAMDLLDSGLNVLNDKLFISEILQVGKIADNSEGLVVVSFDSLLSLGTKIGYLSATYQLAKRTMARSIQALSDKFDVTMVALGPDHKTSGCGSRIQKRSNELAEVFSVFSKRGAVSAKACFADEEACTAATNGCSGHGACAKVQSDCWQCACKPTFDKKLSKTTVWAGADCSKKDIAAQANLLLWTSVALLITLVGGVKLLYSIDSESLPGVLEAATVKRSGGA